MQKEAPIMKTQMLKCRFFSENACTWILRTKHFDQCPNFSLIVLICYNFDQDLLSLQVLIPALKQIIDVSNELGVESIIMGMPHR